MTMTTAMPRCLLCGSDISQNPAALLAAQVTAAVDAARYPTPNWYDISRKKEGDAFTIGQLGTFTLIAKAGFDYNEEQGEDDRHAFVIISHTPQSNSTPILLRKDGSVDSYGEVTWNGIMRPVKARETVVTTYTYE